MINRLAQRLNYTFMTKNGAFRDNSVYNILTHTVIKENDFKPYLFRDSKSYAKILLEQNSFYSLYLVQWSNNFKLKNLNPTKQMNMMKVLDGELEERLFYKYENKELYYTKPRSTKLQHKLGSVRYVDDNYILHSEMKSVKGMSYTLQLNYNRN